MASRLKRSIWPGILIAPLAAPILFYLGYLIVASTQTNPGEVFGGLFVSAFIIFSFATPVSYVAFLVLGAPYIFWLKSKDQLKLWPCSLGGAVFGSVVFTLFWLVTLVGTPMFPEPLYWQLVCALGIGAVLGVGVAVSFCALTGLSTESPTQHGRFD